MIPGVLALHLVATLVLIGTRDRFGRGVFAVAAAAPLVAAVWSLSLLTRGVTSTTSFTWVEGLDLDLAFRVDALSALLSFIVSGIGVLVFVYAAGYFSSTTREIGRFAATLLAFSTAMLGLVWADSVWTLFVFWELTSITSFLLVGHKHADPAARVAARRALLITASGGLALLAGLLVYADGASTRLRDLEVSTGTGATVAAVLVLVAAATKSAQTPFHVWLPGAMSAPTPVSAYLHSATMVKAGIIVLALLQPALADTGPWTPLGLAFGFSSMLWGAIGALRHVDAKLILAWGTVSQLGLMFALLSIGSAKATFAALSILVAHAVFKAALFMVVGEIDVRTGTRDVRELSGLWRSMPLAFGVALVSALSMAGVPPLLGFPAKEAAVEAGLGLSGGERVVVLVGVVGGSILTVAYTARFLLATFGSTRLPATPVADRRTPMAVTSAVLGVASVVGFVFLGDVGDIVRDAAVLIDPKAEVYSLIRWPGLTTAFVLSIVIVVVGTLVGLPLARVVDRVPRPFGADTVDATIHGVLRLARSVTGRIQHGSLPVYMVTGVFVAGLAALPFAGEIDPKVLVVWDHPMQGVLGLLVVVGAFGTVMVRGRLAAAFGLGAIGFGVAGLFVVEGAPDLALTQLLVETVVVVGFVVGLGRLRTEFPAVSGPWRSTRIAVSVLIGAAVSVGLAASASRPSGEPPLAELSDEAVSTGKGNNVVNVILTDMRALDTLGEIVVLVAVAVGMVSLARSASNDREAA
ncbi:hydrogen gas-evolving membrane-bound hydrogenase subunit E [Ilumatobacter coccineus]|uniref:Na(+)/H(+) antiporter subunit A n=1 Tax=Ilumatobacter coccineus (strain NBRC 103263 / KCTC 29153 / YM16-304) TaxID=1313172 RepID=A0A6C7EJH6_ILUCY|nr:hydrogen gas-evolving membrane-bound hydrogenase subunit E [Ilumatobacter coccineus]BAN04116.1 Na(+)/H(+) antiporter subunit A [Ilumatobacter coccineus YM16-304]